MYRATHFSFVMSTILKTILLLLTTMKHIVFLIVLFFASLHSKAQCETPGSFEATISGDTLFISFNTNEVPDFPISSATWTYYAPGGISYTQEFIGEIGMLQLGHGGETHAEVCISIEYETPNELCVFGFCDGISYAIPCPTIEVDYNVEINADTTFTLVVNASGGSGNYSYNFDGWSYQSLSENGNVLVGDFLSSSLANVYVGVDDLEGGNCPNVGFEIPIENTLVPCELEIFTIVNDNVVDVDFIMFNGNEQALYPAVNINWGDGSPEETSELYSSSIHTYASTGVYEICLSGIPFFEDACLVEECVMVVVDSIDQECSASFNATVQPWGYASFINTSSGYYTSMQWTLSNGQTSNQNFIAVDNAEWPLVVTLTVSNSETGCFSTYTETYDFSGASANVCGVVFNDENANGELDEGEQGIAGVELIAISSILDTLYVTTDAEGHYCLTVPLASDYLLFPQQLNGGVTYTPFFASLFFTQIDNEYTQNFAATLPSGIYDASVNCYGYVWVSNVQGGAFYVQLHNLTDMPFTGEFSAECGADEIFIYSSVSGNFSADQRTFSAPITLAPFETRWVYLSVEVDPSVPLGTIQNLSTSFSSVLDVQPANNTCTSWHEVIGSYDPNNKVAVPAGEGVYGHIPPGTDEIVYTINCQNTGTAPAYSVVITDVFEAPLVVEGLETLHSSHPVTMVLNGNQIDWVFNNIVLPDSTTNEPESHCSVTFRVSIDPNLPLGTSIENTAAIYFDANEPIITNTKVHTIFQEEVSVKENNSSFQVYPNPVTDRMFVLFAQPSAVKVYDAMGREVYSDSVQRNSFEVSTENWSSGIYTIKQIENGECVKVIK